MFVAKETKLLTVPVLKLEVGKPRYVKLTGAMFVGSVATSRRATSSATPRTPPTLVGAINLEDSTVCQVQCPDVVKSALETNYPDATYVGKCFSITKLDRATPAGREYKGFKVVEIQDPAAPEEKAAAAASGKGK